MKILQFIQQMASSFKREDVSEKLRMLREALEVETLPIFKEAIEAQLKNKSKVVQDYERAFSKGVHTSFRGNSFEVTASVLNNMGGLVTLLDSIVEKNYSRDIIAAGLTFKRAETLRVIAIADFVVTYARQNLLYLLAAEANVEAKTLQNGKERPMPELNWLRNNQPGFFKALGVMAMKNHDLAKLLDDIPDITVNEDSATSTEQTVGIVKVDPLAANLIPISWNPFYFIGVRMADRENARITRSKQEKRAIEFRLEQLRFQARGENDPKLEKTVEFYENEVNVLAAKIAKYED